MLWRGAVQRGLQRTFQTNVLWVCDNSKHRKSSLKKKRQDYRGNLKWKSVLHIKSLEWRGYWATWSNVKAGLEQRHRISGEFPDLIPYTLSPSLCCDIQMPSLKPVLAPLCKAKAVWNPCTLTHGKKPFKQNLCGNFSESVKACRNDKKKQSTTHLS